MSKSFANRGPACSVRHAAATRSIIASVPKSASVRVRPSRYSTTSTPRPGWYSTTAAPTPLSAAATEFRYSASRSMASASTSGVEMRTTKEPAGPSTRTLRLVRPPGSSEMVTGCPRKVSRPATSAATSNGAAGSGRGLAPDEPGIRGPEFTRPD